MQMVMSITGRIVPKSESPWISPFSTENTQSEVPFADITPPMDMAAVRKTSIFTSIAERSFSFSTPNAYMTSTLASVTAQFGIPCSGSVSQRITVAAASDIPQGEAHVIDVAALRAQSQETDGDIAAMAAMLAAGRGAQSQGIEAES